MPDLDLVMITDPELVMHTDPLPSVPLQAFGEGVGGVGVFPNVAALLRARTKIETRKQLRVAGWQLGITPTCWLKRTVTVAPGAPPLALYGYIPDRQALLLHEMISGADEQGVLFLLDHVEDAQRRGWLWGKWFSEAEPLGEWGAAHRCDIDEQLDERTWKIVYANGWT